MNPSELAQAMLLWEAKRRELDALTAQIEAEVLKIRKTQVVGNVRATYSGGRAAYDYQTPCDGMDSEVVADYSTTYEAIDWDAVAVEVPDVVARHTTIKMVTDYRAMCKGLGIDPVIVSKTGPSVTVKLEA